MKQSDDEFPLRRGLPANFDSVNEAILINPQVLPEGNGGGVDKPDVALEGVAARAGVDEVRIVAHALRGLALRLDMVSRERGGAVGIPEFALQAVDAAECELVPEPGLVVL